jgi:3'(2'), 5'-bisphosphate nucleotidase
MNRYKHYAAAAIQAALVAGIEIMQIYAGPVDVEYKGDSSPLTEADRRAHRVIVQILGSLDKPLPILSEEGNEIPFQTRREWKRYWLIDPLDGTKEFIKKNGEFTVNIALMEQREAAWTPVVGVVYLPAKDILYVGIEGAGAVKLTDATRHIPAKRSTNILAKTSVDELFSAGQRLPACSSDPDILRVVASRSHGSKETESLIAELGRNYKKVERVSSGSSIKLCLVAEGAADVYPRFAPTMEWDTAAGDGVCRAAGALVTGQDGKHPLVYNKEDLHNPWFLVFRKDFAKGANR